MLQRAFFVPTKLRNYNDSSHVLKSKSNPSSSKRNSRRHSLSEVLSAQALGYQPPPLQRSLVKSNSLSSSTNSNDDDNMKHIVNETCRSHNHYSVADDVQLINIYRTESFLQSPAPDGVDCDVSAGLRPHQQKNKLAFENIYESTADNVTENGDVFDQASALRG
jgi:hypothetical protein